MGILSLIKLCPHQIPGRTTQAHRRHHFHDNPSQSRPPHPSQTVIQHIEEAHRQIDEAISTALLQRKPVYIEVCCNLVDLSHPSFMRWGGVQDSNLAWSLGQMFVTVSQAVEVCGSCSFIPRHASRAQSRISLYYQPMPMHRSPIPYRLAPKPSNPRSIRAAVDVSLEALKKAAKVVLLVGARCGI